MPMPASDRERTVAETGGAERDETPVTLVGSEGGTMTVPASIARQMGAVAATVSLTAIEQAARAVAEAETRLRALVAAAVHGRPANGLAVDEIATAAGVGRQTAYRWAEQIYVLAPIEDTDR